MQLSKIKTDKSEAKMIQAYGVDCEPNLWFGQSKTQQESLQLSRLLSIYVKQSTQLKNKIHGEEVLGFPSKDAVRSLNRQLKSLKKEMQLLEEKLLKNENTLSNRCSRINKNKHNKSQSEVLKVCITKQRR